jgi:purine-binding chemotaxis protein CheW
LKNEPEKQRYFSLHLMPTRPTLRRMSITTTPTSSTSSGAATPATAGQQPHQGVREFLSFKLGDEEYGINILRVQEIRGYEQPTRIANAANFVKGVVNLRGVIVPIVDMRIRFGMADVQYDGTTVTIVLNINGRTVGMVVDSVSDVLELDAAQIKPAPDLTCAIDANFITGLGTAKSGDDERMLILMDIQGLMQSAEMGLMDPAVTH